MPIYEDRLLANCLLAFCLIVVAGILSPRPAMADQMAKTPCLRLIETHPYRLKTVKDVQFYAQLRSALPEKELPLFVKQENLEQLASTFLEKEFRACFAEAGISIPPVHPIDRGDKSVADPDRLTLRMVLDVDREKHITFLAYLYRPSEIDLFWYDPFLAIVIDPNGDIRGAIESYLWHRFVRSWAMDRFNDSFQ